MFISFHLSQKRSNLSVSQCKHFTNVTLDELCSNPYIHACEDVFYLLFRPMLDLMLLMLDMRIMQPK